MLGREYNSLGGRGYQVATGMEGRGTATIADLKADGVVTHPHDLSQPHLPRGAMKQRAARRAKVRKHGTILTTKKGAGEQRPAAPVDPELAHLRSMLFSTGGESKAAFTLCRDGIFRPSHGAEQRAVGTKPAADVFDVPGFTRTFLTGHGSRLPVKELTATADFVAGLRRR